MNLIKVSDDIEINPTHISVVIKHTSKLEIALPRRRKLNSASVVRAAWLRKKGKAHPRSHEQLVHNIAIEQGREDENYKDAMMLYSRTVQEYEPKVHYEVLVAGQSFDLPKHPREYTDEI